jgi:hypothetical protein
MEEQLELLVKNGSGKRKRKKKLDLWGAVLKAHVNYCRKVTLGASSFVMVGYTNRD